MKKSKQLYCLREQPLGALMFSFYYSDINLGFQLIMLGENCAIYGCSSLRTTSGVPLDRRNREGTTLLHSVLVAGYHQLKSQKNRTFHIIHAFIHLLSSVHIN